MTSFRSTTLAGQQRAGDGRLPLKFTRTATTSTKAGTRPLGLGEGGRDGLLHAPDGLAPGPVPVMLLLHGAGGTGRRQLSRMIDDQ